MIMQCSSSALAYIKSLVHPAKEAKGVVIKTHQDEPMLALMRELDRIKDDFQLPAIRQRMLYKQIAKTIEDRVAVEQDKIGEDRRRRNRVQAQGRHTSPIRQSNIADAVWLCVSEQYCREMKVRAGYARKF
jgi:hypothetical protein